MSEVSTRFRLLRYFSIHGAVVTLIIAVAMIYIYEVHEQRGVLEAAERQNISLARSFANALGADGGEEILAAQQAFADLDSMDRRLAGLTRDLAVYKVKIFTPDGRTVYSSDRSQVGQNAATNPGFRKSVDGKSSASKTSFRGSFSAFSGVVANVHLAETYVPILSRSGNVVAVFELYTDISSEIANIEGEAQMAALTAAVIFLLHFLASLVIVSRADRLIGEQHAEILSAHGEVQKARVHLAAALKHMAHGLTMFDAKGRLVVLNQKFLEHYGLGGSAIAAGMPEAQLSQLIESRGFTVSHETAPSNGSDTRCRELNDGQRIVAVVQDVLPDGGTVYTHEDITKRRREEEKIAHLAHTDALTGLSNRHHIETVIGQMLVDPDPARRKGALMLMDLDGFKAVNDIHGHLVGDLLLKRVAVLLRDCCGPDLKLARIGGDEFAILSVGNADAAEATTVAWKIIDGLSQISSIAAKKVKIGVSVGVVLLDGKAGSTDELLRQADIALYRAKREGKGQCVVYTPALELEAWRITANDVEDAFRSGALYLVYQPICNAQTRAVQSVEALLRWRHPKLGLVSPSEFIPVVEKSDFIHELGAWVIDQACRDAVAWPDNVRVAVNLSAKQFDQPQTLLHALQSALKASGLPARRLIVEVTETLLLKQDNSLDVLLPLQAEGLVVALDDFGKGYASLDYLRRFKFDKLKIDRCFVADMTTSAQCLAIVRSIIGLAERLGISTVAEGVEIDSQIAELAEIGCCEIQGNSICEAVKKENISLLLAANEEASAA